MHEIKLVTWGRVGSKIRQHRCRWSCHCRQFPTLHCTEPPIVLHVSMHFLLVSLYISRNIVKCCLCIIRVHNVIHLVKISLSMCQSVTQTSWTICKFQMCPPSWIIFYHCFYRKMIGYLNTEMRMSTLHRIITRKPIQHIITSGLI